MGGAAIRAYASELIKVEHHGVERTWNLPQLVFFVAILAICILSAD